MKKSIRRVLSLILALVIVLPLALSLSSCGKETIVIYTSAEDFRIEQLQKRIDERFPDYNVVFEYKPSGDHAAILKSAGTNAGCQIFYALEYGYAIDIEKNGTFADLKGICDFSKYTDDAVISDYFIPDVRNGGAIILNMDVIEEKGLDVPASYEDLLDPQYKGLISMPNPKASGTGYMFLLSLVNAWGEEKAFDYFDKLSENILSFTSSGSGPVNALVGKEVAIGLGITAHGVQQISDGENLKVLFFEEGSPYTLYSLGIISGYETNPAVVDVFKFLSTELAEEQCAMFYPEKIFKDKDFEVKNYPTDIKYANMENNTPERKTELLNKWSH